MFALTLLWWYCVIALVYLVSLSLVKMYPLCFYKYSIRRAAAKSFDFVDACELIERLSYAMESGPDEKNEAHFPGMMLPLTGLVLCLPCLVLFIGIPYFPWQLPFGIIGRISEIIICLVVAFGLFVFLGGAASAVCFWLFNGRRHRIWCYVEQHHGEPFLRAVAHVKEQDTKERAWIAQKRELERELERQRQEALEKAREESRRIDRIENCDHEWERDEPTDPYDPGYMCRKCGAHR